MKMSEKIYECRRKAGLSQEALAEKLGVSRQSVSKWETGEALPETGKLLLLAQTLNVTTDWLLSENDTDDTTANRTVNPQQQMYSWVDAIPGTIGKMFRRYGWIYGVYLAVAGLLFGGIGALAKFVSEAMFNDPSDIFFGEPVFNPVAIFGTAIMILGIVMIVVGVIFAIILRNKSK